MLASKRNPTEPQPAPELDFDVTQQIDAALGETLRYREEPTLLKIDFEDLEISLDL